MVTEDIDVSKVSPALTPEKQFQQKRDDLLNSYNGEISRFKDAISEVGNNVTDVMLQNLKLCKGMLVDCYFSLPYFKKYIEWNYSAFDDIITPLDIDNIAKYTSILFEDEAVYTYIYAVFDTEYFEKLREENIDRPESAERPLSQSEENLFIFFLENVFKPAFIDLLPYLREGRYRPIEHILAGEKEAFDKWYNNIEDEKAHQFYRDLLAESNKPLHDFRELTLKYSRACSFKEKISIQGGDSVILAVEEQLKKVQAIYPANLLMNPTKVAQNLGEITECGQVYGYIVSSTKGKKSPKVKSIVTVMLSSAESNSVKLTRPITLTDRAIIEAVETLAQHNTYITATEVYRMMNGGDNIRMRPELVQEIENRIDYMRHIMAYIDYSQHMNMNGHEGKYTREDTLLNLTKERVSLNGKTLTAYKYKDVSPLFKYARDVGQIVSVPSVMLSTRSGQKGGSRAQAIKHYLLQRLFTIKGQGSVISLETLLKAIGEPSPSPDQLKNIRSIIENFLELWSYGKVRTSKASPDKDILDKTPIKGYSVNTSGKKITGYTLIPKVLEVTTK